MYQQFLEKAESKVLKGLEKKSLCDLEDMSSDDYINLVYETLAWEYDIEEEEFPSEYELACQVDMDAFEDHLENCRDDLLHEQSWEETKRSLNQWIHTG